jgi:hypothetical protein
MLGISFCCGQVMPAIANTHPMTPQAKFSLRAKTRMLELNLSITGLARELRLNRNTVSQAINHGLHGPTKVRIAARLGVPI